MARADAAGKCALPCFFLLCLAGAGFGETNETAGGVVWEKEELTAGGLVEDGDGGFSSMESMLHWAIGHSDPDKLKHAAVDMDELARSQAGLGELMESLRGISDASLMKMAIADVKNSSLSLDRRRRVLEELVELVEPIQNAKDLHSLGGLEALVFALQDEDMEVRALSAWILGKACQNNEQVQSQVLELGAMAALMQLVEAGKGEEAVKGLFAVGALIRNLEEGERRFQRQGGYGLLQKIIDNKEADIRLRRKSVRLVADLAERHAQEEFSLDLLQSVVRSTADGDLELQEAALLAILNLSKAGDKIRFLMLSRCALLEALSKVKDRLAQVSLFAQHLSGLQVEAMGTWQDIQKAQPDAHSQIYQSAQSRRKDKV